MTAYVIARVDVTDADKWMEYAGAAGPTVAAHGGKYIARGGAVEGLENFEDEGKRVVILEFPDMDTARTWYNSAEYQAAKAKREGAGHARFTLVDGYDG
ncbi:MAG: DUF1330 domain-containing protein [Rhizobiaceae bacterium]|nr:DUF1330 domain-containing protein [Rhizobiaceae bacterium]